MTRDPTPKPSKRTTPAKPSAKPTTRAKPPAKHVKAPAKSPAKKATTRAKASTPARKPSTTPASTPLLAAMTGRASAAKAANGDAPVFAYLDGLPEPQRAIAWRVDALAAKTLPRLQRAVKWGIAWYGVGDGWCFCCGGFVGHVKLTFGRGTSLSPEPPVKPIGMGKDARGVDLASIDDLDETQAAAWMRQATALPGFGKR